MASSHKSLNSVQGGTVLLLTQQSEVTQTQTLDSAQDSFPSQRKVTVNTRLKQPLHLVSTSLIAF